MPIVIRIMRMSRAQLEKALEKRLLSTKGSMKAIRFRLQQALNKEAKARSLAKKWNLKNGGNALHRATSRIAIELLVESGCDVDQRDNVGRTPLHHMVLRKNIGCIFGLVTNGANLNFVDQEGNTPLHLAVNLGHTLVVKTLLICDADATLQNAEGKTAAEKAQQFVDYPGLLDSMDHREKALRALYMVGATGALVPTDGDGNPMTVEVQQQEQHVRVRSLFDDALSKKAGAGVTGTDDRKTTGRILSLDGGGIKGLVLTRMLMSIEKIVGRPIIDCFDFFVGTSTGGILALALVSGKSVKECMSLYLRLKDRVFLGKKPYDTKKLEVLLKQQFGEKTRMFDIKGKRVCVTATMADRLPPDTHLFRNYDSPQKMMGIEDLQHPQLLPLPPAEEQLVWRAAKATGAAPSFFRPEGRFVDGAILNNNPSMVILNEVQELNMAAQLTGLQQESLFNTSILVSLGTGMAPVRKTKVVDIFRPTGIKDTMRLLLNYDGMGKLMLSSLLDTDGKAVDFARSFCHATGAAFRRFSPKFQKEIELDEKDDEALVKMMFKTMSYIHTEREAVIGMMGHLLI